MAKYTSAEAAKLLRTLNEELAAAIMKERKASVFTAAVGEDIESVRPAYDFDASQAKIREISKKIRLLKHKVNMFNCETVVPGFDMTIDQILIYIPQLNEEKRRLSSLAARLPKERCQSYSGKTIIEYDYANYDIAKAEAEFAAVSEELAKAQTALDVVNNSLMMEIGL